MASRDVEDCDVRLQRAWETVSAQWEHPAEPFLTCTHRSNEEQDKLYAIGRTVAGRKVTNAKAGQSKHNLMPSLAFDIAFKNPGGSLNWDKKLFQMFYELIKVAEPEIVWGGNFKSFKDYPHFEIPKLTAL